MRKTLEDIKRDFSNDNKDPSYAFDDLADYVGMVQFGSVADRRRRFLLDCLIACNDSAHAKLHEVRNAACDELLKEITCDCERKPEGRKR